jgi:hypothetical protein
MADESGNAKAPIIDKACHSDTDALETHGLPETCRDDKVGAPPTGVVEKTGLSETDIVDSWMTWIADKTQPLTTFIASKAQPWTTSIAGKVQPWTTSVAENAGPWKNFIVAKTHPLTTFIAEKTSPLKTVVVQKADPWIAPVVGRVNRWRENKTARWATLLAIILLISFLFGSGSADMTPMSTFPVGSMCGDPIKTVQPWHIRSFEPKWFGWFGGPKPITYHTKGPKAHQVTFVALDKRNIAVRLLIDNVDQGSRGVEVDNNVNCGDDVGKCLELGFAAAALVVPAGKHTLSAEIVNDDGAFQWGRERKRRVMWMVQECP